MRIDTSNRTIAQLRAFTATDVVYNPVIRITDNGKEGVFEFDSNDTTTVDNTGTVIVTSSSARYKRVEAEIILSSWFDNTDVGFQNFVNVSAGRVGMINNSFTLTTTINMDSGSILQRKGTTVSTSAAVGFLWTRKKNFHATDWNIVSTNSTLGNTLLKIDGLWNSTFDTCEFTIGNANVDVIQMLPGNSGTIWGTYFNVFNNMKTSGGRFICKADGMSSGQPYITHTSFNNCWATGGVSYIKGSYIDSFNFHKSCADSLSGHAFDFVSASNCFLETNEVTPGSGFFTLNEDVNSNKNLVTGARVTDFSANNDVLGWTPDSLTLQGSNTNSSNFRARLVSIFSVLGSVVLQGKGGTNTWIDILKWSETIGTILKSGYSNFLRLQENKISMGDTDQIKRFIKTVSLSSGASGDLVLFSLAGASQNVMAEISIFYRATDNSTSSIYKVLVTANSSSSSVITHDVAVNDLLVSGSSNVLVLAGFYSGTGTTVSLTFNNPAIAATADIEVKYSATSNVIIG